MDFTGLFEMQGMLFTIMILGYIFRKAGMISDEGKSLLTDLVLYVTLPASIIKSFQIEFNHQILVSCIVVIVVAAGIQVGAWLLGMILYPGFPDERKKVLQYATICSNAGILGNPIAEGIFGSMGLLYASIYTIPQRTFMWSIGLTYFTQAPDMKTLIKKVSTHPCIVSVVIGMLIMVFQIPVQGFLSLTIKNIAGGNTFLAMSLVGTILAEVPFRSLPEKDTVYYSFIRLFFIPFLPFPGLGGRGTWRRHCQNKPDSVSLFKEHHVRPPCGAGSSRNRRRPAPFRPQPCIRPAVSRRRSLSWNWRARPGNSMPTLTGASRRSWA